MFRVERSAGDGEWKLVMASPHRIGIDDIRAPPVIASLGGGNLYGSTPSPDNKTVFAGKPGWLARVRYEDTAIEQYEWAKIPENEFDPDSDMIWGWKLVHQAHSAIPAEKLWPLSFVG